MSYDHRDSSPSNNPTSSNDNNNNIPLQDLSTRSRGNSISPKHSPSRLRKSFQRTRSLFRGYEIRNSTAAEGQQDDEDEEAPRGRRGRSPTTSAYERVPQTSGPGSPDEELARPNIPRITTQLYSNDAEPVFDDEGGMHVDMDTMRRGLAEVLHSQVTQGGNWLPGHARIGSRHDSPRSSTGGSVAGGGGLGPRGSSPGGARGSSPGAATGRSTSVSPMTRPRGTSNASLKASWNGNQDHQLHGHRRQPSEDPSVYSLDSDYFAPYPGSHNSMIEESDTIALTDPMHLQPISGASNSFSPDPGSAASTPRGRQRSSSNVVRFNSASRSPTGRLGDDLAERGLGLTLTHSGSSKGSHSRTKSLGLAGGSSPVRRVSVAVQNMSQRVVNLSNDPNADIKRRPSVKSPRPSSARESHAPEIVVENEQGDIVKTPTPEEKPVFPSIKRRHVEADWRQVNPLKGRSLKIFKPDNPLRVWLCDVLVHPVTEPLILLLILVQLVLLTADSARSVFSDPRDKAWGTSWADYAILGLFVVYTLELVARTIVSGFIMNPRTENDPQPRTILSYVKDKYQQIFNAYEVQQKAPSNSMEPQPSLLRSMTNLKGSDSMPAHAQGQARFRLARKAFLRHSFNRLDFVAVVSYWISFVLVVFGAESNHHVYVFRMMSCLRILRLLGITSGTAVILRSLKKAAPLLLNVAFLIGFFWLLFAIIGVQSFKSSLRRTCVWTDPEGIQPNFTQEFQFCGGYLTQDGTELPFIRASGDSPEKSKGYICPVNSICVESSNPYSGTVNFDNIFQSMELVFVIMSSNTFSDLMYYTADSDYLASTLFFVFGVVIMTFWLMNLMVAVITSSFQVIREEEGKKSAFTDREDDNDEFQEEFEHPHHPPRVSKLKVFYDRTEFVWIFLIVTGLVAASCRSSSMSLRRAGIINSVELAVTTLLLVEIIFRFVADWRGFHKKWRNWIDLGLAVITAIIELPFIRNSGTTYEWLTIFQILRIYRVVIFIPVTRNLLALVLGNAKGLVNLLFFVILITFLCSIFAVQLLRGDIPAEDDGGEEIRISFYNIWNSFLGMYQVLSSEGWTDMLYTATQYQKAFHTAWISATFFILWFILSNAIVLNMFIAVIQENFDVTEDEKRVWQIRSFLQRKNMGGGSSGNLSLSSLFGFGNSKARDPIEYGHAGVDMLTKEAVVDEFLDEQHNSISHAPTLHHQKTIRFEERDESEDTFVSKGLKKVKTLVAKKEENPFFSSGFFETARGEFAPAAMAQELARAREKTKRAQREYLIKHPNYNVSLFIFKTRNPIRRLCQRIVGPSHGTDRFDGVPPYKPVWYAFSGVVYAAIVTMVIIACVTTPLYQKNYFELHGGYTAGNWFTLADIGFAGLFTLEAAIKIVADGLFWTPNAFLRDVWGCIDSVVLITLWISVGTSLGNQTSIARAVGAFKALRALRLLNVSDSARETFNSILLGSRKLLSAFFVSLALLIPFAIYGLNLFAGKMVSCNDGGSGITNLDDCVFEYESSPYNWNVLSPRVAANPWYDFDDFAHSLFILFQIVSQEGWSDVLWQGMSVVGVGQQPVSKASQEYAIFFLAFNLLGAVFVLTLFVSIFMRNYTEQTGVAFLTAEQRSWLELRKILRQVRPSKRPVSSPDGRFKAWCYNRAVRKHGRWNSFITTVLLLHLSLLIVEFYPSPVALDKLRDFIFLGFTMIYILNIVVRMTGLTARQYFKSSWDVYGFLAVGGTFATTVTLLILQERVPIFVRFQKLFLVSDTLLLIPRNNQLDQLFKTAAASLTSIGNLIITWFVLFLVYSIALTQSFGLTRIGPNGNGNLNFRNVPNTMIVLFRMSCGEGWNEIMSDFGVSPPYCVTSDDFYGSDCGSKGYARFLFITWNLVSMYIFVNMFVSLIYESFSYVYQQSGSHSAISREEIRRFKKSWSKFDPRGTGVIPRELFPRLLGDLEGLFTMRIYDEPHRVGSILEDCRVSPDQDKLGYGVDLNALNRRLMTIPIWRIRRQRRTFSTFYEECLVGTEKSRVVSFTTILITLAHYKVISDNKSLKLEEYLRRRAKLQMVAEQMQRDTVRGFFTMLIHMRRFMSGRRQKSKSTLAFAPPPTASTSATRGSVLPTIFVETDSTPTLNTPTGDQGSPTPGTPVSPLSNPFDQRAASMSTPTKTGSGGLFASGSLESPGTPSPMDRGSVSAWRGRLSSEPALDQEHLRMDSSVAAQDVMQAFQNSSWGVAMRRSVTGARRGSPRHSPKPSVSLSPGPHHE